MCIASLPHVDLCSIWVFVKHCKTPLSNVLSLCPRTPPYEMPLLTNSFHFHKSFPFTERERQESSGLAFGLGSEGVGFRTLFSTIRYLLLTH